MQAGLAGLKKAKESTAAKPRATPKGAKKPAFVPDSQELVKLRSRAAFISGAAHQCFYTRNANSLLAAVLKHAAHRPTATAAACMD